MATDKLSLVSSYLISKFITSQRIAQHRIDQIIITMDPRRLHGSVQELRLWFNNNRWCVDRI